MALALYLRLSLEDDSAKESDSIANQRQLLQDFIRSHPALKGQDCIEIADDGYSGTNLLRPGFQRLLELADSGEIDCIVVKDFSRFARNYIEAGYYLEEVFPAKGLRFISVNDGFDSAQRAANQGLDLAFRNLIYDLYSKDLSVKVRSARASKMQRGEYMSPYAIYGYKKSTRQKSTLEIDPEAAAVVREIFDMICKGSSAAQTAKLLNLKGVSTPMQYKQQASERSWSSQPSNIWTKDAIIRIIRDRRYTGDMVSNKRIRKEAGSPVTLKVPSEQWMVAEDTHPAIISSQQYIEAQEMLRSYRELDKRIDKSRLLYGKVLCGCCGHVLRYKKGSEPYYFCETSRYDSAACANTGRITKEALEQALLTVLRTQLRLLCDIDSLTLRWQQQALEELRLYELQHRQQQLQGQSLSDSKITLYESYRKGAITKEQYIARQDALDSRHRELLETASALGQRIQTLGKQQLGREECVRCWEEDAFLPKLTAEIAGAAVESVRVFDKERIQIQLRAGDCFGDLRDREYLL